MKIQNRESESRAGCNFKCNIKYEGEFVKKEREYFESGIIQGDNNTMSEFKYFDLKNQTSFLP